MIDSSVARALASSLCTLWCWPSGLVVKVKFSEVIPWSLLTAVHFPPWSLSLCTEARETLVKTEAKKEYVNSICVCCHCMLTPFGSRPTLCLFSLLLLAQVEKDLVALDISYSSCLVGLWLSWHYHSPYCLGNVSKFFHGCVSVSYILFFFLQLRTFLVLFLDWHLLVWF